MTKKINCETNRLTRDELDDYKNNSGISELQFKIIKLKYFNPIQETVEHDCQTLNITKTTYHRELNKALLQIRRYDIKRIRS